MCDLAADNITSYKSSLIIYPRRKFRPLLTVYELFLQNNDCN